RRELRSRTIGNTFRNSAALGRENAVGLRPITVDQHALRRVIGALIEAHAQSIDLFVGRIPGDAQAVLQREVRAKLPAILGIELIVPEAEVAGRDIGRSDELCRTTDKDVSKDVAG